MGERAGEGELAGKGGNFGGQLPVAFCLYLGGSAVCVAVSGLGMILIPTLIPNVVI